MNSQEPEKIIYRFKKDDPEYKLRRKLRCIELTKEKYKNDIDFKEKAKTRSFEYYHKLKNNFDLSTSVK